MNTTLNPLLLITNRSNLDASIEFGTALLNRFKNRVSNPPLKADIPNIFTIVADKATMQANLANILYQIENYKNKSGLIFFSPKTDDTKPNQLIEICESIAQHHNYVSVFVHCGEQPRFKLPLGKICRVDYEIPSLAAKAVVEYLQCMSAMQNAGQTKKAS